MRLNAEKAEGKHFVINWTFTDLKQQFAMTLENSALTYVSGKQAADADSTISLPRNTLDAVMLQKTTFADAAKAGLISGDAARQSTISLSMLDTFKVMFEVVEPKTARP